MSVLYVVVPAALALVIGAIGAFLWAARRGQFDDVTTPAMGLPQWLYTVWLPALSLLILWRVLQLFFRAKSPGG